jgi:hypothetical protein
MAALQELDEARHDSALDHPLDRRVLLLREQLAELHRRVQLTLRVLRKHIGDHLVRELARCAASAPIASATPLVQLTGGSPLSSSESPPPTTFRFRRLEMFSSRFCLRISTCCSSRRRRRSSAFNPLLLYSDNTHASDSDRGISKNTRRVDARHTATALFATAFHCGSRLRGTRDGIKTRGARARVIPVEN